MVAVSKGLLAGALGLVAVGEATLISATVERTIVGRASVVDGDTVDVAGTRIRLAGIDAPESSQRCLQLDGAVWPCGRRAAFALADHIGSAPLTCRITDTDRHGRAVARCRLGQADIGGWMVDRGWAFAHPRYGRAYRAQEAAARARRVNIWSGVVEAPWDYRRRGRFSG